MHGTSRPDDDLNSLVERNQGLHQAIERHVLKLVASHLRYLELRHPGDRDKFGLANAAHLDQVVQLHCGQDLGRQFPAFVGAFGSRPAIQLHRRRHKIMFDALGSTSIPVRIWISNRTPRLKAPALRAMGDDASPQRAPFRRAVRAGRNV